MAYAKGGFDYVLIARRPALTSAYTALVSDLVTALRARASDAGSTGEEGRGRGAIEQNNG